MSAMRSCIKTGCRWPAAATLSYRYSTSEVWLSDLGEDHPSTHDLCPHHADTLRVPRKWTLVDDRRPAPVMHEPTAAEIVERVSTFRGSVERMLQRNTPQPDRTSRYAELLADLPTYDPPVEPLPVDAASTDPRSDRLAEPTSARPRLVGHDISHQMAPVVRDLPSTTMIALHDARHRPVAKKGNDADEDGDNDTATRHAVVLTLPLQADDFVVD